MNIPEKTFQFLKISSIDPNNIEGSKPITIELTAQQIILHKRRNTEIWRNYIQIEDKKIKTIDEENINRNNKLESEEELNNQREIFASRNDQTEEITEPVEAEKNEDPNFLEGDFDAFVKESLKRGDGKVQDNYYDFKEGATKKRGRKPKNK